jgi:hypothetical protein
MAPGRHDVDDDDKWHGCQLADSMAAAARNARVACRFEGYNMLELAIGTLLASLLAGALGFTGSQAARAFARFMFAMLLIVALVLFVMVGAG